MVARLGLENWAGHPLGGGASYLFLYRTLHSTWSFLDECLSKINQEHTHTTHSLAHRHRCLRWALHLCLLPRHPCQPPAQTKVASTLVLGKHESMNWKNSLKWIANIWAAISNKHGGKGPCYMHIKHLKRGFWIAIDDGGQR